MKKERIKRKPTTIEASLSILFLLVVAIVGYVIFKLRIEVIMLFSTVFSGVIAYRCGYSLNEMLEGMTKKIGETGSMFIFITGIGFVVGTWLYSGTIPVIISWLVRIVNPQMVLFLSFIVCSIVSACLGTGNGTIGTAGVIMFGVCMVQGINPGQAAGAIVSGCIVGQVFSPVADMPTLSGQLGGESPLTAIKLMLPAGGAAYIIAAIAFLFMGFSSGTGADIQGSISIFVESVNAAFSTSPIILLPIIMLIVLIVVKVPPAFCMFISGFVAIIIGTAYQGFTLQNGLLSAYSGFNDTMLLNQSFEYSAEFLNLVGRGGMTSNASMYVFIFVAMIYAGLMSCMGSIEVLAEVIFKKLKTSGVLIFVHSIVTLALQACVGSVYGTVFLSSEMFGNGYTMLGLSKKNMIRVLQAASTLGCQLIPWTSNAVYVSTALGVEPLQYIPYNVFVYMTLILTIVLGFSKKVVIPIEKKSATAID